MKMQLFITVILFFTGVCASSAQDLVAFRQSDGKWGYKNSKEQVVLKATYQYAGPFEEGIAAIRQNGLYGYINSKGKPVTPIKYNQASFFGKQRLAAVSVNGQYGFIDRNGKEVIPLQYDLVLNFKEGLAWVKKNKKYGAIDESGKTVIPFEYDHAFAFENGIAKVKKEGKDFQIDPSGKILGEIKPAAGVTKQNESKSPPSTPTTTFRENGKTGLKDANGKVLIKPEYDIIMKEQNGYIIVVKDKKYGAYNLKGEKVLPNQYESLFTTSNPNQFSAKINGQFSYINTKGEVIKSFSSNQTNQTSTLANNSPTAKTQNPTQVQSNPTPAFSSPSDRNNTGEAEFTKGAQAYKQKNYPEALNWFQKAAAKGYTKAYSILGLMYHQGDGVVKNPTISFKWYMQAAEKGYLEAMHNIGVFYINGQGVKTNYVEARKWLKASAKAGYKLSPEILWELDRKVIALNMLNPYQLSDWESSKGKVGFIDPDTDEILIPAKYDDGGMFSSVEELAPAKLNGKWGFIDWSDKTIIPFQFEDASPFSFYEGLAAVKKNGKWGFIDKTGKPLIPFEYDSVALGCFVNGYAKMFKNGQPHFIPNPLGDAATVTTTNQPAPNKAPQTPAKTDKGDAEFNKGLAADKAKNYTEAMKWYRQAADKGSTGALHNIGSLYYNGLGVPQNLKEAFNWYKKGADLGSTITMHSVAVMYANGIGTTQNYSEARKWYLKAAEKSHAESMHNLSVMYYHGQGVPIEYNEAYHWAQKAAALGYEASMHNLGVMYELGKGVPKNLQEARKWYQQAADKGHNASIVALDKLNKPATQPVATAPKKQYQKSGILKEGRKKVLYGYKWGFVDASGVEVIPAKYDDVQDFNEGLAGVSIGKKWGVIDWNGKEIIPPNKYDYIGKFVNGYASMRIGSGSTAKWGIINKKGEETAASKYELVGEFHKGRALVFSKLKYGFIDESGKEIIPLQYDFVRDFTDTDPRARVWLNNKVGFIDLSGKVVVPIEYESATYFLAGEAEVTKDGRKFKIDKNGKEIK